MWSKVLKYVGIQRALYGTYTILLTLSIIYEVDHIALLSFLTLIWAILGSIEIVEMYI